MNGQTLGTSFFHDRFDAMAAGGIRLHVLREGTTLRDLNGALLTRIEPL